MYTFTLFYINYVTYEIYYKELAYFVVEAETTHDLLSVRWRPRKASDEKFPYESQGLRARSTDVVSPSPRAED